ncbi:uncharacterized protein Dana_GF13190 [Drosophila ananassae]|uniref:NADP-retinol dehydrogenase n=1 Tax=Drosophila ananassae TaxID=7217 RepID=B3MHS1_DROAN|nr:retinol dehydrogenase 12 [Drosophila ananassae]EDV36908.1 uncharacterized protein Dana_GF13190 [Drosophila ananassae]
MNEFGEFLLRPEVYAPIGTIIALYLIRHYVQGRQFTKKTDETGKVVIVTGCNTGIGKETVLELAHRGATVYMACRNMVKCEEARKEIIKATGNRNIFSSQLDLSSMASIRSFATRFMSEESKLHILINNAGIMDCPRMLTKDGFEMQIGVNHMGHFLLTLLLLDVLKATAPSRIVVVSSLAHRFGTIKQHDLNSEKSYSRKFAYAQSKLANVLFTRELAKRLTGSGVTVNALHPGVVDTELIRYMRFFGWKIIKFISRPVYWVFFKTPKSGAQTTLFAALDPKLENVSGQYFSDCKPTSVGSNAKNEKVAKFLWEESEKWTGMTSHIV